MATEKSPLVSVIMPMYNSAQFIPQTLESLLYQTMTDFEVVIVDDCSTDNSVEVVENFSERFGGRLKVIKLPKNTGTPGIPRNFGIRAARGKYIAFLDSDDFYTKTALEEVTNLLENHQADVLYLNDTYMLTNEDISSSDAAPITDFAELINSSNFGMAVWRNPNPPLKPLDAPTFESDDLEERIKHCIEWKYRFVTYANFCRRDFLLENNITFPDMVAYEDNIFNFACICLAKKLLLAPNIVYIIRQRIGSASRDKLSDQDIEKYFRKWANILNSEFNELEKIMVQLPLFKTHINYRYAILEFFFRLLIGRKFIGKYSPEHSPLIYQFLKKEFHPFNAALTSYLFDLTVTQQLKIIQLQAENKEFKEILQSIKDVV